MKIKCVVVGDPNAGKTSMITSMMMGEFKNFQYIPTVFESFSMYLHEFGKAVKLELWDTGGKAAYDRLRPLAYMATDIYIVCFSMLSGESFDHVRDKWLPEIRSASPNAPIVLVGTKSDLWANQSSPVIDVQEIMNYVNNNELTAFFETSAVTLHNLQDVLKHVVKIVMSNRLKNCCKPKCTIQ